MATLYVFANIAADSLMLAGFSTNRRRERKIKRKKETRMQRDKVTKIKKEKKIHLEKD